MRYHFFKLWKSIFLVAFFDPSTIKCVSDDASLLNKFFTTLPAFAKRPAFSGSSLISDSLSELETVLSIWPGL